MNGTTSIKRKYGSISKRMAARIVAGGLVAGIVNGIFGNGAGVIIVFLIGGVCKECIPDERAAFANVTAAVLPMALTSAFIYSSYTPPSLADAVSVSAASLAGGIIGACILGKISVAALKKIFATVMVVSGIVMLIWG